MRVLGDNVGTVNGLCGRKRRGRDVVGRGPLDSVRFDGNEDGRDGCNCDFRGNNDGRGPPGICASVGRFRRTREVCGSDLLLCALSRGRELGKAGGGRGVLFGGGKDSMLSRGREE